MCRFSAGYGRETLCRALALSVCALRYSAPRALTLWVPWTALGRHWVPPHPTSCPGSAPDNAQQGTQAPSLVPTVRHCLKTTDREGGLDHCPLVYFCQVFRCLGQRGNLVLVVPFDQNRKAFCLFLSGVWEPDFKI